MLKDIVAVKPLTGYRLLLRFEDGVEGVADVSTLVEFTGVFAPLKDEGFFAAVQVNPDIGTVCWPNGADIDPDVLYGMVTGEPLAECETTGVDKPGAARG